MAATLALVVALAGGAVAGAATLAQRGNTIGACVKTKGGAVRIVSANAKCRKGERKTSWNRVGPAGAPGARGPQGSAGARGAQGAGGPQGPAGTARAYGRVEPAGAHFAHGVLGVTAPTTGIKCVKAANNVTPATGYLVATVDYQGSSTDPATDTHAVVEVWRHEAGDACPDDTFQVVTLRHSPTGVEFSNEGFFFIIG